MTNRTQVTHYAVRRENGNIESISSDLGEVGVYLENYPAPGSQVVTRVTTTTRGDWEPIEQDEPVALGGGVPAENPVEKRAAAQKTKARRTSKAAE